MKKLIIVDVQYLYYKYMFTYMSGRLAKLTCGERDTTMLFYPLKEIKGISDAWQTDLAVCFDSANPERKDEDPDYKKNRTNKLSSEDRDNIAEIKSILDRIGIKTYKVDRKEADDLVKTVKENEQDKYDYIEIYTPDSDLLQLVDKKTEVHLYKTGKGYTVVNYDNFEEMLSTKIFKTYVPYNMVMAYKSTVGDTSDGIKGIPKFGPSAFNKWINQYSASINFELGTSKEYVLQLLRNTIEGSKVIEAEKSIEKVALRYVEGLEPLENRCTRELREQVFEEYEMYTLV